MGERKNSSFRSPLDVTKLACNVALVEQLCDTLGNSECECNFLARVTKQVDNQKALCPDPFLSETEIAQLRSESQQSENNTNSRKFRKNILSQLFPQLQFSHVKSRKRGKAGEPKYTTFRYHLLINKTALGILFLEVKEDKNDTVVLKDGTVIDCHLSAGYYIIGVDRCKEPISPLSNSPSATPDVDHEGQDPQQPPRSVPLRQSIDPAVQSVESGELHQQQQRTDTSKCGKRKATPSATVPCDAFELDIAFDNYLNRLYRECSFIAAPRLRATAQTSPPVASQAATAPHTMPQGTARATVRAACNAMQGAPAVVSGFSAVGALWEATPQTIVGTVIRSASGIGEEEEEVAAAVAGSASSEAVTSTLMHAMKACISTVVIDGAGIVFDFALYQSGFMTENEFCRRLTVRCRNLARNVLGNGGGDALGSLLLTPLLGSYLAPIVGRLLGNVIASRYNERVPPLQGGIVGAL